MLTKGNWLARQLQELEAQVKVERQRLHDERRQQARSALIQLSLPELLGEVRTDEPEQDAHWESVAPRMH
jgi:hypothetical protein